MFTRTRFYSLLLWVIPCALLFLLAVSPGQAQPGERSSASDNATAELVNPDGTLNLQTGFRGALDLTNWRVMVDRQHGPLFAPQVSEWSGLGNGVSSYQVNAIAVAGNDVYVGGDFTEVCGNISCDSGNSRVNYIARWDGNAWHALGFGLDFNVRSLALGPGGELYVGGDFSQICGNLGCSSGNTTARRIAKWDGNAWSALGHGFNLSVLAVAVAPNGDLYAGGGFSHACGNSACNSGNVQVNYVARWDGNSWSALDFGLDYSVYSLAFSGNNLLVGGQFVFICGNLACDSQGSRVNYIAQWNGSEWSGLDNGLDNHVSAIATQGSRIVAGGNFTEACGNIDCDSGNVPINHVAEWNGINWTAVGFGVNYEVLTLALSGNGDLFAGGVFTVLCGNLSCSGNGELAYQVARWDDSGWHPLAHGLNSWVHALGISETGLVAGGQFWEACGNSACNAGNVPMNRIAQIPLGVIAWNNPAGGSWGTATNWTPQQVPGSGDETLFNLDATYDVTVGTHTSGRSRIEDGSVSFRNADLTLIGPLTVGGDATFTLPEGSLDVGELIIGSLPPTNPLDPPTAHAFISNQGTQITGNTAITIGHAGNGDLLISDAQLTSGPVAIGAGSPGSVVLTGQHGEWTTAGFVVGAGYTATLTIEHGGFIHSGSSDVVIGQGEETAEHPAIVHIDNAGSPLPTFGVNWFTNMLTLGGNLPGKLIIENGGAVGVIDLFQAGLAAHDVALWDASLLINGIASNGSAPSSLTTFEDILLGMAPETATLVEILGGAKMETNANLSLGHEENSQVFVKVSGVDEPNDLRSTLSAAPNAAGECWIGFNGFALLEVLSGGLFTCRIVRIGNLTGSQGDVYVHGEQAGELATLQVSEYLCVGGLVYCGTNNGVPGSLTLANGGAVLAGIVGVGPAGRVRGNGTIIAGDTVIHGHVEPGIGFELPVIPPDPGEGVALNYQTPPILPATLTISGNVTVSSTAVITLDVRGHNSYDQLVVNGDLALAGGALTLAFSNGYAPQQGDMYEFFLAENATGDFSNVAITGLAPGFEYMISTTNGVITLTALNDGIPTTPVEGLIFLPLIMR